MGLAGARMRPDRRGHAMTEVDWPDGADRVDDLRFIASEKRRRRG